MLVYIFSLVALSQTVVANSPPILNWLISAVNAMDLIVPWSAIEALTPRSSAPILTFSVKLAMLIFKPADERISLSARPCAYTESGLDESPLEARIVEVLVPLLQEITILTNCGASSRSYFC